MIPPGFDGTCIIQGICWKWDDAMDFTVLYTLTDLQYLQICRYWCFSLNDAIARSLIVQNAHWFTCALFIYFDISLTHSITGHNRFNNDLYFRNSFGEYWFTTVSCCNSLLLLFVGGLGREGFVITCAKGSVSHICMLNIAKFVS